MRATFDGREMSRISSKSPFLLSQHPRSTTSVQAGTYEPFVSLHYQHYYCTNTNITITTSSTQCRVGGMSPPLPSPTLVTMNAISSPLSYITIRTLQPLYANNTTAVNSQLELLITVRATAAAQTSPCAAHLQTPSRSPPTLWVPCPPRPRHRRRCRVHARPHQHYRACSESLAACCL